MFALLSPPRIKSAPTAAKSIWDEFPHDIEPGEQEQWFRERFDEIGEERENTYWRLDELAKTLERYAEERATLDARLAEIDHVVATIEATVAEYSQHMDDIAARETQLANWAAARGLDV